MSFLNPIFLKVVTLNRFLVCLSFRYIFHDLGIYKMVHTLTDFGLRTYFCSKPGSLLTGLWYYSFVSPFFKTLSKAFKILASGKLSDIKTIQFFNHWQNRRYINISTQTHFKVLHWEECRCLFCYFIYL